MKTPSRRRPFLDLRPADVEPATGGEADCFLGRFPPAVLARELEGAGILAALEARGYRNVALRTDVEDDEHRLCLLTEDGQATLMELRTSESTCLSDDPGLARHGVDVLYFLAVRWLMLQDPGAAFTADRPPLPGQQAPGLHLGRRVYGRLMAWATDWGKDGLLNFPEYFHNAVFYASLFRFVSPVRQGRLEALRRDLAGLHVAEASWAVARGRVIEEPLGRPLLWDSGEMVAPITRGLHEYLDSSDYRQVVERTRNDVRFRVT